MNKDDSFQVIIIGSGPAGSAAAYVLAEKGYRVALIEKKTHPRYKPCGGAVPVFVNDLLEFDVFSLVDSVPVNSVYFTLRGKKETYANVETPVLHGVDRSRFDEVLYKKAKEAGCVTFPEEVAVNIKEYPDRVEVTTKSGKKITGKFLLGADGANSVVRSKIFNAEFQKLKTASSIVWEAKNVKKEVFGKYQNCVHMDFNWYKCGYFGLIPKFDHLTLGGYVSKYIKPKKLKTELKKFCAFLKLDTADFNPAIRYYPYYDKYRTLHTQRCLLAGDAACLVDALSGEGIKYAFISALVATKILEYAIHGKMGLKEYTRVIHNMIGKELLLAKKMMRLSYLFPSITYGGMVNVYEDTSKILNNQMSYSAFIDRLTKRIKRKLLKIINPLTWFK